MSWSMYQWLPKQDSPKSESGLHQLGAKLGCPIWEISSNEDTNSRWLAQQEAGGEAAKIWRYRVRLSQLTSPSDEDSTTRAWPNELVESRSLSIGLVNVLSKTVSFIFAQNSEPGVDTLYMRFLSEVKGSDPADPTKHLHLRPSNWGSVFFSLRRRKNSDPGGAKWSVETPEVEAALALSLWSILNKYPQLVPTAEKRKGIGPRKSFRYGRILARKEDKRELPPSGSSKQRIQQWECAQKLSLGESTLWLNRTAQSPSDKREVCWTPVAGPAALWERDEVSNEHKRQAPISYSPVLGVHSFGWNTLSIEALFVPDGLDLLVLPVEGPTATMCAQDIFTGFLRALLLYCERPLGPSHFVHKGDGTSGICNPNVGILINILVNGDLGSKADAVACIIPTTIACNHTYHIVEALEFASESAMKKLSQGSAKAAYDDIEWTVSVLECGATKTAARDCFLQTAWIVYRILWTASKGKQSQSQLWPGRDEGPWKLLGCLNKLRYDEEIL
ncbi:hypothetical protein K458DRAFT_462405 [Lentithecium fluviatile CBS 122367]|uniref:Uncharacterized protein n=1 Tax=Lentithecium fluviatile CBS 122367 TaxID=1168545 RepID=A0A6G1JH02_9PLEO|nr:hypothetical protein K458DRAFT_462405 [Lentithecium fluviatile CBS 122367]